MKASELIALLNKQVEDGGDLEVVVCGLDGAGYDDIRAIETIPAVQVDNSVVCKYTDVEDAKRYGKDPVDQRHFIYIGG